MESYRDLEIFEVSTRLAIEVHFLTLTLPKFEMYEEGSQVRRSSKAITSAIVEGYGRRRYRKDFIRYLIYALTECDETIVHLNFLEKTESARDVDGVNKLKSEYIILSKRINSYLLWVETERYQGAARKNGKQRESRSFGDEHLDINPKDYML
jgi:four helix bundle protein